jgi:hypothetical protein
MRFVAAYARKISNRTRLRSTMPNCVRGTRSAATSDRHQACHVALDIGGRLRLDPSDFPPEPSRARKPPQWRAWTHHRTTTRMMMRRPRERYPASRPTLQFYSGLRSRSIIRWTREPHQGCSGTFHLMLRKDVSRIRLCCSLSEWSKVRISRFQKINAASGLSRDGWSVTDLPGALSMIISPPGSMLRGRGKVAT